MDQFRDVEKVEVQVLIDFESDPGSLAPKFNYEGELTQFSKRLMFSGLTVGGQPLAGSNNTAFKCVPAPKDTVVSSKTCCVSSVGFCYLIHAYLENNEKHTVLFDCGPDGTLTLANADKLGVDLSQVEAIVLSHRHFDHVGGILPVLDRIYQTNGGKRIPVYCHPLVFSEHGLKLPNGFLMKMETCASIAQMEEHGATVVQESVPTAIAGGSALLSGEIERVTPYEKGLPAQVRKVAPNGDEYIPDPLMPEEQFVMLRLSRGRGLIVFSACSHAGIINVLRHATKLSSTTTTTTKDVHVVMGGFHLIGEGVEDIIDDTVEDMKKIAPKFVVGGHCTGYKGKAALRNAFGDMFHNAPTGSKYVFGGEK